MLPNGQQLAIEQLEMGFRSLGYSDALLREDYVFADLSGDQPELRSIALAIFAQEPPTYRSATFGVARSNGMSGEPFVQEHRSLGAPQVFEVGHDGIRLWKLTNQGTPSHLREVAPDDIEDLFLEHGDQWSPRSALQAKLAPTQMDLFDRGLMSLLDREVSEKLDRLLQDAIGLGRETLEEQGIFTAEHEPQLYALISWFVAAKVLRDQGVPGGWNRVDPEEILQAVGQFYFKQRSLNSVLHDPRTRAAVWKRINAGFQFQNLTLDAYAYAYENTLVTSAARRSFGIHSTPREIAEYIVDQLPFEDLARDDRKVFEPFSGHAVFLVAAMQRLRDLLPPDFNAAERHNYFVERLSGLERDSFANEMAILSLSLADFPNPDGWKLLSGDVFSSPSLKGELDRANVVLCNPPFEDFGEIPNTSYPGVRSSHQPAEILHRILQSPPMLLGFVLPRIFLSGAGYRPLRQQLADTYASIRVLALPDNVFQHSEQETALLMASGLDSTMVRLTRAEVYKQDLDRFLSTRQVSYQEEMDCRSSGVELEWQPSRLRRLWKHTSGMRRLGELADFHVGVQYLVTMRDHKHRVLSDEPRDGFVEGVHKVKDSLEPYFVARSVYLSNDAALVKGNKLDRAWNEPKVIVNKARRSRGNWWLTASVDRIGLLSYQNAIGIWPKDDFPLEVIAAVLNGPVANAFVKSQKPGRDVNISTLRKVPIPVLDQRQEQRIIDLVQRYIQLRSGWQNGVMDEREAAERCSETLVLLDAIVLRAYDLPSQAERDLIVFFGDESRGQPIPLPAIGTADVDADLWIALSEAGNQQSEDSRWPEEIGRVIHSQGLVAVELLRDMWRRGHLQEDELADVLREIGYVDEPASHRERRLLLAEALFDQDPVVRQGSVQGLSSLNDRESLADLRNALRNEQNSHVRDLIEVTIRSLSSDWTAT